MSDTSIRNNINNAGAEVITYHYNAAGLVESLTSNKLGGAYSHSYVYDDINRLISANGKAKTASYQLDMTYGIMG